VATSGSTNFSLTCTQIISEALEVLGILGPGITATADELQSCKRSLNMMVKSWQTDGLHLWLHTEAALFLVDGQAEYDLPGANVAKVSSLTETALSADAADTDTTVDVDSITGISTGDTIGVVQDDDTILWTTVNGAPAGSTVTLTDALTAAASEDNRVWVYSDTIERPNRITDMRRRHAKGSSDDLDTPVTLMLGRRDYFMLPNKSNTGVPVQAYYDPQTTTGKLYVWPAPDTVDDHLRFTYSRPLQDFDGLADDPDFPTEWIKALVYNLAVDIAPKFGLRPFPEVIAQATNTREALLGWDREMEPIQFEPEMPY